MGQSLKRRAHPASNKPTLLPVGFEISLECIERDWWAFQVHPLSWASLAYLSVKVIRKMPQITRTLLSETVCGTNKGEQKLVKRWCGAPKPWQEQGLYLISIEKHLCPSLCQFKIKIEIKIPIPLVDANIRSRNWQDAQYYEWMPWSNPLVLMWGLCSCWKLLKYSWMSS